MKIGLIDLDGRTGTKTKNNMGAKKKWRNERKRRHRESVARLEKEFVDIIFRWEINGKIYRKKKKRLYSRGRESSAFDLESAAQIIYMWDKVCCDGITYGDEAIKDLAKILPNKSGLTERQIFEKYWVDTDAAAAKLFKEGAERSIKCGYVNSFDEYIAHRSGKLMEQFSCNSLPVKQALLWFIFKYCENQSFDELKADIGQIPQKIADMVDRLVDNSNRRQEENRRKLEEFNKNKTT